MKNPAFHFLLSTVILLTACNENKQTNPAATHDRSAMTTDSANHVSTTTEAEIKTIPVAFTNVDGKAAGSIRSIVDQYLQVKTALSNDQPASAAEGASSLQAAINNLDKSLLTAAQKANFDEVADQLAQQAVQIQANATDIKAQRAQFVMLSESVYSLAKSFGGGRPLYHAHCPMARDNQGAMWLSDEKAIKNPYFGAQMPGCGTVEEVIQ